jgi:hypothetical protein
MPYGLLGGSYIQSCEILDSHGYEKLKMEIVFFSETLVSTYGSICATTQNNIYTYIPD